MVSTKTNNKIQILKNHRTLIKQWIIRRASLQRARLQRRGGLGPLEKREQVHMKGSRGAELLLGASTNPIFFFQQDIRLAISATRAEPRIH